MNIPKEWRSGSSALPPMSFTIVGIVEFPFDDATAETVAGRLLDLERLCAENEAQGVDMLLVKSKPGEGADRAATAIQTANPSLHVVTNEELVERFSRVEFSYFRQISFVLATVTLFFGFLLIAVLLTASVNQRLGEIAALRAMGLSRWRVVAGVLCAGAALVVGARRDPRTRYRRDPWALPEWLVSACGLVPAAAFSIAAALSWEGIVPLQVPLEVPTVPLGLAAAVGVGALAALAAPVPPLLAQSREARA